MNKIYIPLAVIAFIACQSPKQTTSGGKGDTRTVQVENLNENVYKLVETATDKSYGYIKNSPIDVGGIHDSSGPLNERRYLNALLGPEGQEIKYSRVGSCCSFRTTNALIGNAGMLDHYKITWEGAPDTLSLFLNMYDKGNLKIPFGLRARE